MTPGATQAVRQTPLADWQFQFTIMLYAHANGRTAQLRRLPIWPCQIRSSSGCFAKCCDLAPRDSAAGGSNPIVHTRIYIFHGLIYSTSIVHTH